MKLYNANIKNWNYFLLKSNYKKALIKKKLNEI